MGHSITEGHKPNELIINIFVYTLKVQVCGDNPVSRQDDLELSIFSEF